MKILIFIVLLFAEHRSLASEVQRSAWHRLWTKRDLSFGLLGNIASQNQTSSAVIWNTLREAFSEWQVNSCFTFRETAASLADIKIIFINDNDKQDKENSLNSVFSHKSYCPSKIKNVAAHAFFRSHEKFPAQIHINNELFWLESTNPPGSISLKTILLHEIGHVLGLYHSSSKTSVMYKIIYTNEIKRVAKTDTYNLRRLYKGICGFNINKK